MVNQEWSGAPFNCSTEFPVPGLLSDHSPCVVKLSEQGDRPIRPFRFYNMWISHPEFHEIVRSVWTDENLGTKQFMLCRNLRALKHPLKRLNKRAFWHISERPDLARITLETAHKKLHDLLDCEQARQQVNQARTHVVFLDKVERSFYYQKAKCSYIREGDRSIKFFHNLYKRNNKGNYVASLLRSDEFITTTTVKVLDEFVAFY